MPHVQYGSTRCDLNQNETVLDGLLRAGVGVPHACKAGSCGSCMMKVVRGAVPARAQTGLKDSWKARGYFLPCVCLPENDIEAVEVGDDARVAARIVSIEPLSHNVLKVVLAADGGFDFRAGQYLTLIREGGVARSYSIASLPGDGTLELHVRVIPGGAMSGWLVDTAKAGDEVQVQGPSGECFYVPGQPEQPMLLIGTGTGLAPLYGIVRDALSSGHAGPIHLFHGALNSGGLYLRDELAALDAAHANFSYSPTVLSEDGAVDAVVTARHPNLGGWRGFVCGDPTLVRSLKKKLFLAGIAMRDIYSDAFLPAVTSTNAA